MRAVLESIGDSSSPLVPEEVHRLLEVELLDEFLVALRAFKEGPPRPGVVKQVALAWGFWHMGHFARECRELFGESPSKTVSRHEQRW